MAFTADPTTNRGKVRLLVYDTTEADAAFNDAEIDALLELNSDSVWLAAADACRALAAGNAPKAYFVKISTALEVDKKQVSKRFLELSEMYMSRAGGSTDTIWEFTDSAAIGTSATGHDTTEYVKD